MPSADTDLRGQNHPSFKESHLVHTVTPVVALLYVPTGQSMQADAPMELLAYVPATQTVQILDLDSEYFPALHCVHTVTPVEALLYVPTSQAMQAVAPTELSANVPATQTVHVLDPRREDFPAPHNVLSAVPPGQKYPDGHKIPAAELLP